MSQFEMSVKRINKTLNANGQKSEMQRQAGWLLN